MTGDEAFMPHYEPLESDTEGKAFNLRMMPYELINFASGWLPSPPYLTKTLFDDQLLKILDVGVTARVDVNQVAAGSFDLAPRRLPVRLVEVTLPPGEEAA